MPAISRVARDAWQHDRRDQRWSRRSCVSLLLSRAHRADRGADVAREVRRSDHSLAAPDLEASEPRVVAVVVIAVSDEPDARPLRRANLDDLALPQRDAAQR